MTNVAITFEPAASPPMASRAARIRLQAATAACAFVGGLVLGVQYFRVGADAGAPIIAASPTPVKVRPAPNYVANDDVDVAQVGAENDGPVAALAPLVTRVVKTILIRPDGTVGESSEVAALDASARQDLGDTRTPGRAGPSTTTMAIAQIGRAHV
mgnify:CR=1 FL=1